MTYFSDDELKCKGSGELKLHGGFRDHLDALREELGFVMEVRSGCRSPEYNEKVGGAKASYHLTENPEKGTGGSMAVDISILHMPMDILHRLIFLAGKHGFSIGINYTKRFIHLDRRIDVREEQIDFKY